MIKKLSKGNIVILAVIGVLLLIINFSSQLSVSNFEKARKNLENLNSKDLSYVKITNENNSKLEQEVILSLSDSEVFLEMLHESTPLANQNERLITRHSYLVEVHFKSGEDVCFLLLDSKEYKSIVKLVSSCELMLSRGTLINPRLMDFVYSRLKRMQ